MMDLQEAFDAGFEAVKAYVDGIEAKMAARLDALEKQLSTIGPTVDGIGATIGEEVAKAVASLPTPVDGKDGAPGRDGTDGKDGRDGVDGKDAPPVTAEQITEAVLSHPEAIAEAVKRYLEANPPKDGKDGRDGVDGAQGPAGPPGEKGLDGAPGRDGRDGLPGVPGQPGEKGRDGKDGRDGVDGKDGLGFDDMTVEHDGERGVVLRFARGEQVKEFRLKLPVPIYRGVFSEGQRYERGDTVTWGGHSWHCNEETTDKPGTSKSWTLAVKRGRDGSDAKAR